MAVRLLPTTLPTELERLVEDYLTTCRARGLSPRTIENSYGPSLKVILLAWCADEGITAVEQLDRRALDRYSSYLLTKTGIHGRILSPHTVHSYLRPVRQMLTWAAAEGEAVKGKPQLPRLPKRHRDVLSREEIDRLEAMAQTERDALVIRVLGDCGLRVSELTGLRTTDIVRGGRGALLKVLGKGNRERRVPIMPSLLRRIDRHVARRSRDAASDHLFLSRRRGRSGLYEPLTSVAVKQMVAVAGHRAGLNRRIHPHLFRHSFMTEMLRSEMNPIQLSVIAGASPEVISRHYEHLTQDDAFEAMIKALTASERSRRER